jgi:hypothetical protein
MEKHLELARLLPAAILCLLCSLSSATEHRADLNSPSDAPPLFSAVTVDSQRLAQAGDFVIRQATAQLSVRQPTKTGEGPARAVLGLDRMKLNLFPDVEYVAERLHSEERFGQFYCWSGRILSDHPDDISYVILVAHEDRVRGKIWTPQRKPTTVEAVSLSEAFRPEARPKVGGHN